MEDFIANNYPMILIIISLVGILLKFGWNILSKKTGIPEAVGETAINEMTDFAKNRVEEIKAQHNKKDAELITSLVPISDVKAPTSSVKPCREPNIPQDGFRIIKQPSSPNNFEPTEVKVEEKIEDESG